MRYIIVTIDELRNLLGKIETKGYVNGDKVAMDYDVLIPVISTPHEIIDDVPQGYEETSAEELSKMVYNQSALSALDQAKAEKIAEVEAYDKSDNVNGFTLNGVELWLDKDTRVGLRNLFDMQKSNGQENTLIWYEGMKIELPIETAYQLLSQVELYAFECYNTTEQHKIEINALTSVEEVEAYDITKGYPSKLSL